MSNRPSLAELRNRLKERDTSKPKFTKDIYPFWNMNFDQEAHIRILYDGNEENPFQYFIEKKMHKLSIAGKQQTIACTRMFGEDCPICDRSYKFYKAEGKESQRGKLYYADKSYIMKAIVLKDPLPEDSENGSFVGKVVTLQVNRQLADRINADLATLEDTDTPFELKNGINFVIRKTKKITPKGDQADYTSSSFARRPSDISDDIASTVTLVDLTTILPKNPGIEKIAQFLDAHDRGTELGADEDGDKEEAAPVSKAAATKVVENTDEFDGDDKIPFEAAANTETTVTAQSTVTETVQASTPATADADEDDLVAAIMNRNKGKK